MDGVTIAALVGAVLAIAGAIGGVVRWASQRFERLNQQLLKVQRDHAELFREHSLVLVKLERTRLAFQMVATELARKSPGNSALALARSLLDEAFKIDTELPQDMQDQLAEIDRITA